MISNRPLVLRSNRFFGSALINAALIDNTTLETANEKLLEAIQNNDSHGANLLNILLFDLQQLDETVLIDHIIDNASVGLIDLSNYNLEGVSKLDIDLNLCRSTFTIPFDQMEGITMIASAYYLSKPAVSYWDDYFEGKTIWYVTTVASIAGALERLSSMREESK